MSHNDTIYPLMFHPTFKDYPWGGRNLETVLGRTIPTGIVAESWEIAGHPNGSTIVRSGELSGLTLPQVQEQLGESLVGSRNRFALERSRFPLLIKLLDANNWLSVQVHPDDEYGLAHESDFGKTEMWVVLHAKPNAEIIFGFETGVTKEIFAQAIAEDKVDEWLHRVPVKSGDVIMVPAGSIHALGPGVIVAEIQQNSDTTYRIYDWGRPRPIHVEQALDVLNFDLIEPNVLRPAPLNNNGLRSENIGHCQYFHTERIMAPKGKTIEGACDGNTFEIWAVLSGEAKLHWSGTPVESKAIEWILLPAVLGNFAVEAMEDCTLLRVFTP
ncbi:MAG: type I phosphomannose isomerase catalytic subunit [Chloroflexota bacterium]